LDDKAIDEFSPIGFLNAEGEDSDALEGSARFELVGKPVGDGGFSVAGDYRAVVVEGGHLLEVGPEEVAEVSL
jgi:hypothetical protein